MKTRSTLLMVFGLMLAINISHGQNYKAPKIDFSGKITDKDGKHIGNVTTAGVITDTMGMKVAYINAEGMLIDEKTGKKLGKAEKNGNFIPVFAETPDKGWSVSTPLNGICMVKDKDGNIKAEVHENYKQFGACAVHCLTNHMNHDQVIDDKNVGSGTYACPMHPDVTSGKPGKCSKCGMALVKKEK